MFFLTADGAVFSSKRLLKRRTPWTFDSILYSADGDDFHGVFF